MSELRRVTEFDVEVDPKAPREVIAQVVMDTAHALCVQHRLPPTANIVLAHDHEKGCPEHAQNHRPNFVDCTCDVIRIVILVASDALIKTGEMEQVLHKSAIDPEEAN